MSKQIVVIGSSKIDMISKVDHLPKPGKIMGIGDFLTVKGGKGANQSVAVDRTCGNLSFISCAGNETFGAALVKRFQAALCPHPNENQSIFGRKKVNLVGSSSYK